MFTFMLKYHDPIYQVQIPQLKHIIFKKNERY